VRVRVRDQTRKYAYQRTDNRGQKEGYLASTSRRPTEGLDPAEHNADWLNADQRGMGRVDPSHPAFRTSPFVPRGYISTDASTAQVLLPDRGHARNRRRR
jgi:hypothetical protein